MRAKIPPSLFATCRGCHAGQGYRCHRHFLYALSDAPAAIDWLQRAFGFAPQPVVPDAHGGIAHAQLRFGNGMVMLGSMHDDEFGKLMAHPDEMGGRETQSAYLIVEDADAVYTSAKAAGSKIVTEIKDEDYGGRGFSCRDLEGHVSAAISSSAQAQFDLVSLFERPGCSIARGCWCMFYRESGKTIVPKSQRARSA